MKDSIEIFEATHPGKQALFVFYKSSAHASLPPDALKAFKMNKPDGGKQWKQRDTVIPQSNPSPEHHGKPQKMTLPDGCPKGLQRVLEEHGFNVSCLHAKCSPVCPIKNTGCCMACLLSQQEYFKHQASMLETFIHNAGHKCIFLLKFHCELNPIEMVCHILLVTLKFNLTQCVPSSIGAGASTTTVKPLKRHESHERCCSEISVCLSHRGHSPLYQSVVEIYECVSTWIDGESSCMGCQKAKTTSTGFSAGDGGD